MTCKKCGRRIKEGTPVCPRCGAPQTETVSLGAINAAHENKKKEKKPLTPQQIWLRVGIIALSVLAAIALALGGVVLYIRYGILGEVQHGSELSGDLNINEYLPPSEDVLNIALFGLDDRDESADGHSDSIIILSIDRVHNKIKLTSIARDTLVPVEGYKSVDGKTKITHAFSKGGVSLAVKTLNANFGMNIQDYVYVNFRQFAAIIDYIGGVVIDVQQRELNELNKHIYWMGIECDAKIDEVKSAGEQRLTGYQALAYARIRKIDSDIARGNRQKDVLKAMFDEVKKQPITSYPGIIKEILGMCYTNPGLDGDRLFELAKWAVIESPTFENYSLPADECKAWGGDDGVHGWVWIYDLQYATNLLHNFIYESGMDPNISRKTTYVTKKTTTAGGTTAGTTAGTTTPTGTDSWGTVPTGDDNPDNTDPTGTGTEDPTGTGTGSGTGEPTDTGTGSVDPTGTVGTEPTGDQPVQGTTTEAETPTDPTVTADD